MTDTTTTVILTGTGIPLPSPGRAGAGTLVRHGSIALQFDAGRGTVVRLTEAGVSPHALTAQFVTHVHSDHVVDLADVVVTRWIQQQIHRSGPLTVVAAEGAAARFARRMFEVYDDDISLRVGHVQAEAPTIDLRVFEAKSTPAVVWRSDAGIVVEAVAVHHEPVIGAVAYRVTTPKAVVVISGDTRVCDEVEGTIRLEDPAAVANSPSIGPDRPSVRRCNGVQLLTAHHSKWQDFSASDLLKSREKAGRVGRRIEWTQSDSAEPC
jgi:ribonuclease Z